MSRKGSHLSQYHGLVLGAWCLVKSQVLGAWSNRRCLVESQVRGQIAGAWLNRRCLVLGQIAGAG